jgi:hypothetical protein
MKFYTISALFISALLLASCSDDESTPKLVVPTTYQFDREGATSVVYAGQTDRINQLTEIKNYLKTGDNGALLDAQVLYDMFANTGGNGNSNFTFTSSRQLRDKAFVADITYYEGLFDAVETASVAGNSGTTASNGVAGTLTRSNSSKILVDGNGHEFTQIIEKGMMGSIFLNQIFNVYLTDARVGNDINNSTLVTDQNYTDMEHYWDEAFGYFAVPIDFPTNTTGIKFWGNYSNVVNPSLSTNELLMNAFLKGRAAIVAKRYNVKDEQREILYEGFELVAAATAIHYLNGAKDAFVAQEKADAFHELSEAIAFIRALRLSPYKKITNDEITVILDTNIGQNFWTVAESDLSGLNSAINTLVNAYDLESVKDQL